MEETTTSTTSTATTDAAPEEAVTPELTSGTGHTPPATADHAHGEGHPSPFKYVGIAVFLAFVTAIEVGLYYLDLANGLMVALLMGLALVKFATVAGYFMHLKFDSPMLRRLFVTGIVLAAVVYFIALVSLDVLFG
ncbi:MAG: cytochrome C oxidase subunit IV family protein [Acidimicrobiia bacterium]